MRHGAQRFFAEVRLSRQVSHPNACGVCTDVGEIEGQDYLSMEYVDGEDLASLLKRIGRLPPDKALEISRELCAGLAAAHDKGVLHRDLKPSNVMIDGRGRARITDFGLAVAAHEVIEGEVSGTPAYMAPEQLAGKGASVRSDIYALGLVLYELSTGRKAFDGARPRGAQAQARRGSADGALDARAGVRSECIPPCGRRRRLRARRLDVRRARTYRRAPTSSVSFSAMGWRMPFSSGSSSGSSTSRSNPSLAGIGRTC